ncbi:MAG TPA: hypothetical protein VGP25_02375 [Gemmatimonadaceae bacterium]|jgi:hypothetical protein|nr:hypothetical protein [Gemmatimonadaceae bacterium]
MVDEKRSVVLVTQNHDSLRVFALARALGERKLRVGPLDAYALLTRADGATQRRMGSPPP